MGEIILLLIFIFSLVGMGIILIPKIPVLVELSAQESEKPEFFRNIKNKLKNQKIIKIFSGEILLQKILSKIRILTLKAENKTNCWLGKLRQKSLEKKTNFSDDYWQKIKKEDSEKPGDQNTPK